MVTPILPERSKVCTLFSVRSSVRVDEVVSLVSVFTVPLCVFVFVFVPCVVSLGTLSALLKPYNPPLELFSPVVVFVKFGVSVSVPLRVPLVLCVPVFVRVSSPLSVIE